MGFDLGHSGYNPLETHLSVENVPDLKVRWTYEVGAWVISQAVFASGVEVPGRGTVDVVYVGNENGVLFALDARDPLPEGADRLVWSKQLGAGVCNSGINGVTGSPAIDRATNRIYAASGDNQVYALDLATGELADGWPVPVTDNIDLEHIYSALTLANGLLYANTAGACGDETKVPYRGRLVAIDPETAGVVATWVPNGADGPYGGGIWSPAGVTVHEGGDVFTGVANANQVEPENVGYNHDIVRLTPMLEVVASHDPGLEGFDMGITSAPVLYHPPGCPPLLVAMAKTGEVFVYEQDALAEGPIDRELIAFNLGVFLGMPAYSPETNMVYVSNSNESELYRPGLVALEVDSDCGLSLAWQAERPPEVGVVGPPTVANGVVYYASGTGNQAYAFDAETGEELWNSGDLFGARVAHAPLVVNGHVYIGTWANTFYALAAD
jgi:outer membrane protein assembly factor BamB